MKCFHTKFVASLLTLLSHNANTFHLPASLEHACGFFFDLPFNPLGVVRLHHLLPRSLRTLVYPLAYIIELSLVDGIVSHRYLKIDAYRIGIHFIKDAIRSTFSCRACKMMTPHGELYILVNPLWGHTSATHSVRHPVKCLRICRRAHRFKRTKWLC